MEKATLSKQLSDKIGRNLNLVYNQASMYNTKHPAVVRAIEQLHTSLKEAFKKVAPIVFSMNQEQFFVEDEAIDYHINTVRMADYFTKGGLQSVSFEEGISIQELKTLIEIIFDSKKSPDVNAMKNAIDKKGLKTARVNYVFYKKVTSEEEIVLRERLRDPLLTTEKEDGEKGGGGGFSERTGDDEEWRRPLTGTTSDDVLEMMMAGALSEEMEKNFSIAGLLENPSRISQLMIEADIDVSGQNEEQGLAPGPVIVHQLQKFSQEVGSASSGEVDLQKLAECVLELKRELLKGIEARKALGVIYADEEKIIEEANQLTDSVMVRLVVEEYNQGAVSVKRLAQIILRLIPEADELKRLLPQMKKALMDAGMHLRDFLELIQELKHELQSDDLSRALEQGAQEIGLEGEELIREILADPKEAAELIFLASEIRKGVGDRKDLTNMLVQYVEQVGGKMALDELEQSEEKGDQELRSIYSRVRSELMTALKGKAMDSDVLAEVESRITQRLGENIRRLKSDMILNQVDASADVGKTKDAVLKILGTYAQDEKEMEELLKHVKDAILAKGLDEGRFQQLYDEILGISGEKERKKKAQETPRGTMNRNSTLFILESEIRRSRRYGTPFSTLSIAMVKVTPQKKFPPGSIMIDDIRKVVMSEIAGIMRETDMVGMVDANMIVVIQPMTQKSDSKISMNRVMKVLKEREFVVKEIPFEIQFACVPSSYNTEGGGDFKTYIKAAQQELQYLTSRLSNIQSFM